MSCAFAAFTSDSNLLPCELARLHADVDLSGGPVAANAAGLGWYADEEVLLQRYPSGALPRTLGELPAGGRSEALLYHARALPVGMSLEDNIQPFRFRRWLFMHAGELAGYRRYKQALWEELPDFLKRSVLGETDSEVAFALFLKHLRDAGRLGDDALEPAKAAQLLGVTVRRLEELAAQDAPERRSVVDLIATDQRMLLATRLGAQPLYYRVLTGRSRCEACQLERETPRTQARVRAHERCRTVVVATHLLRTDGWQELAEGSVLAVGRELELTWVRI